MKRYYRSANDPKRFKPLVTGHLHPSGPYWVVSTNTFGKDTPLIKVCGTFDSAITQANAWADEYRAAWVAANMKAA